MSDREQIERAIANLETQSATLGQAALEAALSGLRGKLAELGDKNAQGGPIPAMAAERKHVTILFADISGFTSLSERMDPEALRDMINACFAQLVPCIKKYNGTVDKFIGDEIMALFGAPIAHENDPECAVRAALEIVVALNAFNAERGTDLGVHCGINTGLVLAGDVGSRDRQDYSVIGDAVNLAARLKNAAGRGQIFVGHDTYRLTAAVFDFAALEPIRVKGKDGLIPVYQALKATARPGRVRGLEIQGIRSSVVGREKELETAKDQFKRLLTEEQGGIICIIGEPGLGKSRLLAEIRKGLPMEQIHWLEGQTMSFGQAVSYWPFQVMLRGWAEIAEDDTEEVAWRKLEGAVNAVFAEQTIDALPYLATLLALEVKGEYAERVKYLDGEAMGKQIFLNARRLFERLSRTRPLVLVLEDLHWMDASSLELLEYLLPLVVIAPVVIIGLTRPVHGDRASRLLRSAAREYAERYREIRLMSLSVRDSAQLVDNLLAIRDMSPTMRELIVRKADGNPFFLEEIIRTMIATGTVVRDPATGQWRVAAQIVSFTIPDTIQGVIMARVDLLDEELKRVLRMAAVIGRTFFRRLLAAVFEASNQLDAHLSELKEVELIQEKQVEPEFEYIFKHAMAQEATYESILLQKRRELHACVGRNIETLFAGRLEEFYSLLAFHYAKAEMWEKAQEYLFKAGDQAGSVAGNAEALNHYQQAMTVYARAFGDKWSPVERAALERKIGEALYMSGEYLRASRHLRQAMVHLGLFYPDTRTHLRKSILLESFRQLGHRLLPHLFIRSAKAASQAVAEEVARVTEVIGWVEGITNANPERLLWITLVMLNFSERSCFAPGMLTGASALGAACDYIPLYRLAARYHRVARSYEAHVDHPGLTSQSLSLRGMHANFTGEWRQAFEDTRKAAQIQRELGDIRKWGFAALMKAKALSALGDLSQAEALCDEMISLGMEINDPQLSAWGLRTGAPVRRQLGRNEQAIEDLLKCIEISERLPDHRGRVIAGGELGQCYLRKGNLPLAMTALEAAGKVMAERKFRSGWTVLFYNQWAEACLFAVENEHLTDKIELIKKASSACQDALKMQSRVWPGGLPEAMRLQGRYQWVTGKRSDAEKWWSRSLAKAGALEMRYEAGMTYLEAGLRMSEHGRLRKAEEIFAEIGAETDLAKAREALGT